MTSRMDGKRRSPTYNSWSNMIQRCSNPHATDYHLYGGKGIAVCDRWLSFDSFFADMGERPKGCTLDRKDGSKGYELSNCRWADIRTQNGNRSGSVLLEYQGQVVTVKEAADLTGIPLKTLYGRAQAGKTGDALFAKKTPRA